MLVDNRTSDLAGYDRALLAELLARASEPRRVGLRPCLGRRAAGRARHARPQQRTNYPPSRPSRAPSPAIWSTSDAIGWCAATPAIRPPTQRCWAASRRSCCGPTRPTASTTPARPHERLTIAERRAPTGSASCSTRRLRRRRRRARRRARRSTSRIPAGALSVDLRRALRGPGLAAAPDAGLGEGRAGARARRLPLPPRADPLRLQARPTGGWAAARQAGTATTPRPACSRSSGPRLRASTRP